MSDRILFDKLTEYSLTDYYPLHMPGHKRKPLTDLLEKIGNIDITEINDFDNLAKPEGILKDMQNDLASYCGVKKSFYLVNGSTVGILTAISAAVPKGGKLLIARNSHKSTYHGMYLRDIEPVYMYPEIIDGFNCFEAVTPEIVSDALKENQDVNAVLIVSPTYEGRIADIEGIAEVVHQHLVPLIVDEAHGAHLNYTLDPEGDIIKGYAVSACRQGADLIVQSFHKTLPSPTQTAVLHFNSDLIDLSKVEKFLHIYQTSSPSYPFMAGIQQAHIYMKENSADRLKFMYEKFTELVDTVNSNCLYIYTMPFEDGRQDVGKFLISCRGLVLNGKEIADVLREKYHLETEMSVREYCLAMFTAADEEDAYIRTAEALIDIDTTLKNRCFLKESSDKDSNKDSNKDPDKESIKVSDGKRVKEPGRVQRRATNTAIFTPAKAWDMKSKSVKLEQAAGLVAGDFIGLYPPGTPILVPGELITAEHIADIKEYISIGYDVTGISDECISVVNM